MAAVGSMPASLWVSVSAPTKSKITSCNVKPRFSLPLSKTHTCFTLFSTFPSHFSLGSSDARLPGLFSPRAASSSSVGNAEYVEEPTTNVKFQRSLSLPGCSTSLSLFGTGYREKVFAIIGVKVYAAGLYVNESILNKLDAWRGRSAAELQNDSSLFETIFKAPLEKSLSIVLVRDVDGKTFWDALDEAISPRIKSPSADDETALSTFRSIFQGRPLKKGTFIVLTWVDPTKMLVCVSTDATPSSIDAKIESANVTSALFDVFLGGNPVSPSLKASVANGLEVVLK
nr:fatty-acid-binding protein 3, chloroplastic isoform X1 [Ipomoea trifida]